WLRCVTTLVSSLLLLAFLFRRRTPPRSTLSPYTTLFRSMLVMPTIEDKSIDLSIYSPPFAGLYNYSSSEKDFSNCESKEQFLQPDRKSTRLNSSHVKISYAVLCLKKKRQGLDHLHHPLAA